MILGGYDSEAGPFNRFVKKGTIAGLLISGTTLIVGYQLPLSVPFFLVMKKLLLFWRKKTDNGGTCILDKLVRNHTDAVIASRGSHASRSFRGAPS
jgi:hypothetical protein